MACVVVCVMIWPLPLSASPHDGRFLLVGFLSFCFNCYLDTEVTALHHNFSFSPLLHLTHLVVTKDLSEVGCFCHRPPSPLFPCEFVCLFGVVSLVALSLAVLGEALLALFCFCVFSERGGRFPVEPWTRLHCSEHYWRCPVVLPAVQSGAPECSKACPHGSLCGCSVLPWQWPTRWERVASSGNTANIRCFWSSLQDLLGR